MAFPDALLPVRPELSVATDRILDHIAGPGEWLTGAQRTAVAAVARRSLIGDFSASADLSPEMVEAAQAVATAADETTPEWIADLEARGLGAFELLEIIGVVSKMSAVDTCARGLGAALPPIPIGADDAPARRAPAAAARSSAWLPTVGRPGAPTALAAVPKEEFAQDLLHSAYYLSIAQMGDLDITVAGLHRTQMELAAARISYLNDCVY